MRILRIHVENEEEVKRKSPIQPDSTHMPPIAKVLWRTVPILLTLNPTLKLRLLSIGSGSESEEEEWETRETSSEYEEAEELYHGTSRGRRRWLVRESRPL